MFKTIKKLFRATIQIMGITLIIAVSLWFGYSCGKLARKVEPHYQRSLIPTPYEIQKMLKQTDIERYDPGSVDGIIGKNTMKAWENYVCDQYAKESFEQGTD